MPRRPFGPLYLAPLERLHALVTEHGLDDHRALIDAGIRPAIGLRTRLPVAEDLDVGATRFGGDPDVPPSFAWPAATTDPVTLIAQIRLQELAPLDLDGRLPAKGLLSVFAETSGWPAFVYLFDDVTTLERRARPAGVTGFRPSGASVEALLDLPESLAWPEGGPLARRELDDRYYDLRAVHIGEVFPTSRPAEGDAASVPGSPALHQLLGHVPSDADYADTAEPEAMSPDQEVLLAFDSDCLVGMEFGDSQRVWLLIDRARLAARDFSAVRCAL